MAVDRHKIGIVGIALLFAVSVGLLWPPAPGPAPDSLEIERAPVERPGDTQPTSQAAVEQGPRPAPVAAPDSEREAAVSEEREDASGIRLTVTDSAGAPIAGARVQTFSDSVPGMRTTDGNGACVLPVAAGDGAAKIFVEADGYHHKRALYSRLEELRVRLPRETTVFGTLRDARSKQPVSGAEMRRNHNDCRGCEADEATTDDDGTFELVGMPVGKRLLVLAVAEGYPRQVVSLELESASERTQHDLELLRGVAVSARVVDLTTGLPVEGVAVTDYGYSGEVLARSGADGNIRALFVERDTEYTLGLTAAGYCRMRCTYTPEQVAAGQIGDITMPRAVPFVGTVRGVHGQPVAGARIGVRTDHGAAARHRNADDARNPLESLPASWRVDDEGHAVSATTDAEGRFETPGVLPWSGFKEVFVGHDDYRSAKQTVEQVGGPGERVDLVFSLTPLGSIGTVAGLLTVNGQPREGHVRWKGGTRSGSVRVERSGRFRIEDVEAGAVELTAAPGGFGSNIEWGNARHVLQVRGGEERACDFALEVAVSTISGTVIHEGGLPLMDVGVDASSHGGSYRTKTGSSGTYSLKVPATGAYRVSMSHGGDTQLREGVAPGTTGLDFVVKQSGQLRYRVVDKISGKLVERFEFSFRQTSGGEHSGSESSWARRGDSEGWSTRELPVGQYELMVHANRLGYRPARIGQVVVRAGNEPTKVTIEVESGATVELRLGHGAKPLPRSCALLLLEESAWEDVRYRKGAGGGNNWDGGPGYPGSSVFDQFVVFERGTATLRGLAEGRYRFKAFGADIALSPEYVDVGRVDSVIEVRWQAK